MVWIEFFYFPQRPLGIAVNLGVHRRGGNAVGPPVWPIAPMYWERRQIFLFQRCEEIRKRSHLDRNAVAVLFIPLRNPFRDIRIRGSIVRPQAGDHDRNERIGILLLLQIPQITVNP
ncbi:hypothetical protein D3C74_298270 [compost metagenome]